MEAPGQPVNGDRVTQAVMARLTEPPAPIDELAAQLIARAELSRTRRLRLRRTRSACASSDLLHPSLRHGVT